jgi:penicillin-binding protein-related factor A (putative recombinase)
MNGQLFPRQPALKGQSQANRGRAFEKLIQLQLSRYQAAGWLVIRNYPAVLLQEGGKSARVIGKAPPDWLLVKNGDCILIDAKSHQGERWPLAEVAPHQAAWFDNAQQAGCIVGIVLQFQGVWWLSWEELGPRWHRWEEGNCPRGLASLDGVELEAVGSRVEGVDFLSVAVGGRDGR